jgi:hypothetical protein
VVFFDHINSAFQFRNELHGLLKRLVFGGKKVPRYTLHNPPNPATAQSGRKSYPAVHGITKC